MAGVQFADGSGLSNDNRVTCQVFVDVLARSDPTDPLGAGLPVAGVSGTLTDVFTDSPVAGRMQAKTGTLGNAPYNADPPAVKTLSGYLPVDGGGAEEFSLLLNARARSPTRASTARSGTPSPPCWPRTRPARPRPSWLPADVHGSPEPRSRWAGARSVRSRIGVRFRDGGDADVPAGDGAAPGRGAAAARVRAALPPARHRLPRRRQRRPGVRRDDDRAGLGGRRRATSAPTSASSPGWSRSTPSTTVATPSSPSARGASASTPGCPTTRTRWPTSTTGPTRTPTPPGLDRRVDAAHGAARRRCSSWPRRLGESPVDADLSSVSDDPLVASYHLAALSPIGPADRYRLLCARSPAERLDLLLDEPRRRRGDAALPPRVTGARPAGEATSVRRFQGGRTPA